MDEKESEKVTIAFRRRTEEGIDSVTAVGTGTVAEKIEKIAREHGIRIEEEPEETEDIFRIHAHQVIPPRVYALITELINFTFKVRDAWKGANLTTGGGDGKTKSGEETRD
jgi:flagellar biosynthesis protein